MEWVNGIGRVGNGNRFPVFVYSFPVAQKKE
jgi:hypothetical protein